MKNPILEALNEPACDHSHHDEKKLCAKPKPGESGGGCSFDGAQITLVPIADAAHLVHGPIACSGNSWEARGSLSSGSKLFQYGFTTDLSEHEIIFGGEKKLSEALQTIRYHFQPPAVFVYETCVTALIGEDLNAICKRQSEKLGIPIIPVNSPGFVGSKNLGTRLAGEALLDYVVGTAEPPDITAYDINVIGEYNIAGELWDIEALFAQLGIRILSRITGDGRFQEIRYAHRAKVNMVVCSRALINMARKMQERYHIPYFEGSFYGFEETSSSLRKIAKLLNDQELELRVERLIEKEEKTMKIEIAAYRKKLAGKRAILYTGGVKSWSIITALQELGIKVVGVGTNKSTQEEILKIKERTFGKAELIESGGASRILAIAREQKADMIIAGGRNMYVALKEQIPFLDINQERHHAYAGYSGIRKLAENLINALEHPVWANIRLKAPWEEEQHLYDD